ncbi:metallophosphoesterase family protein [Actinomadura xylanilytica]|uniref:metallophosphoesterase family protein n=1 Tax=Actinomadura xylanilytica TaxID=887459 RepID=UPI00255A73B4|nr:metallophosphoesterase family protein [Actinomadura xylanilytica]MDL4774744.1 metallophosphoesterase family protein [Actinomadura xylanilytica]
MRADDAEDAEDTAEPRRAAANSRTSEAGAGWVCGSRGTFNDLLPERVRPLSWRRPSVLWRSRNDVIARLFGDPCDAIRRRCVTALAERGTPAAFTLHRPAPEFSFAVLGDTGEGDRSQYAVVPPLLAAGAGTDFMVIASDVIYPTGDTADYPAKFLRPYRDYPGPIYAVPGNHDWYDGLRGFLRVFCDLDADCAPPPWRGPFGAVARLLWRRSGPVDERALAAARAEYRGAAGQRAVQPGPYWAIDTPSLRIIGIDTGVTGRLDRDQGAWLREISAGPKAKLLVTGKPLRVDDDRRPGAIEGGGTVDEIVQDPRHHYIAAIGGDIHNYQRYPVRVGDRTVQYLVSGGGGAFMHATHIIPRTHVVDEEEFRCYPLRGDSLSRYSKLYGRWLRLPKLFELTPEEATAAVEHRLGIRPGRGYDAGMTPSRRARFVAAVLGVPRGTRYRHRLLRLPVRGLPQLFRSEMADWDRPPFFKSFLRVDVGERELRIRCFAATGCGDHEADPPCEDEVTIPLR